MNLYLYETHSYYNRKIVRYRYTYEYEENLGNSSYVANNISFNPNDGITTSQIVNYPLDHPYFEGTAAPSYCLVVDDAGNIVSRWWITSHSRIRKGQANLSLLRDVIADYYDEVMTAPSFVQKGYVKSTNDTAIFNNEGMTFNQIKTSETPIKDASESPWYVGYISKTVGDKPFAIPKPSIKISHTYKQEEEYPYAQYQSTPFVGSYAHLVFKLLTTAPGGTTVATGWGEDGEALTPIYDIQDLANLPYGSAVTTQRGKGFAISTIQGIDWTEPYICISQAANASASNWKNLSYSYTGAGRTNDINEFLDQDNTYIQIGTKVYKVLINSVVSALQEVTIPQTDIAAVHFKAVAQSANTIYKNRNNTTQTPINTTSPLDNYAAIEYQTYNYTLELVEQPNATIDFTLPVNRPHCIDAPYDIIALPAGAVWLDNSDYSANWDLSKQAVSQLMLGLAAGSEYYDWQLLPYCPLPDTVFSAPGKLNTKLLAEGSVINIDNTASTYTFAVFAESASFTKRNTTATISVPTDSVSFKVANECDTYRLCSPNYNGQFEFSAAKNGGVNEWLISCTYKPYNPYIKVAPVFGRLYGRSFSDARGLVCGGDFSIAQISDAWTSYELNNKNYQVMFDRQIQNMEVNNSVQRIMERVNAVTGTISGAVSGGMAGGMTGNSYAAAAGAVIGGVSSAIGGIADIQLNERLRQEAMDYARDQFGYQLQNIKALPYSLTKVGAQNNDYKKWPFVEYYTCSDIEKQALLDKMKWNGMTIMRVGQVQDFLRPDLTEAGTFIQARPIRFDYITEDSHFAEAIAAELNTGVYII